MHQQELSLFSLHTLHRPLRYGCHVEQRSRLEANGILRRNIEIGRAILLWRREAARRL
jgi:hypothetical protein